MRSWCALILLMVLTALAWPAASAFALQDAGLPDEASGEVAGQAADEALSGTIDEAILQAPGQAAVDAPVDAPVEAPAEAPAEVPKEAPADIRVEVPTSPLLLGDWFDVVVEGPELQNLRVGVEDHVGDVLIGRPQAVSRDGVVRIVRRMCIARQGEYSLPLSVVTTTGETYPLAPLELNVLLDVPDGNRNKVADLLDPIAIPMPAADIAPFLGACVLLLALLGLWVVAEGREKPIYEYRPPADLVAIEALTKLRLHLPRTSEEVRPFVIEVSDVLRVYMEQVFEIHAPAQTTEEFLEEAASRHDALGERRETLAEFLIGCDLVKYAGERPAPASAEPLIDTVESFVEETRAGVIEPEPELVPATAPVASSSGVARSGSPSSGDSPTSTPDQEDSVG